MYLLAAQWIDEHLLMLQPYITTMPICLITACESAPDVAYAVEFGQRWCAKAGVDVSNTLVLPADYTEGVAKEYFQ